MHVSEKEREEKEKLFKVQYELNIHRKYTYNRVRTANSTALSPIKVICLQAQGLNTLMLT